VVNNKFALKCLLNNGGKQGHIFLNLLNPLKRIIALVGTYSKSSKYVKMFQKNIGEFKQNSYFPNQYRE
jgi:hypothetical protein